MEELCIQWAEIVSLLAEAMEKFEHALALEPDDDET